MGEGVSGPGPRAGRVGLALLLACLAIYNANLREVSSQDTFPNRLLPVALLTEGRLTLDMFFRGQPTGAPLPYWVHRSEGRYVSPYPLLPALLAVPVYAGPLLLAGAVSWPMIKCVPTRGRRSWSWLAWGRASCWRRNRSRWSWSCRSSATPSCATGGGEGRPSSGWPG